MSIRRSPSPPRKNFTIIANETLSDSRLTWEARGLLGYLLSKPDDWRVSVKHLMKESPSAKKDKLYALLNELREHGYADLETEHDGGGKFAGTVWVIYDSPQSTASGFTVSGITASGETASGESGRIVRTDLDQELNRLRTEKTNTSPEKSGDGVSSPKPYEQEFQQLWDVYPPSRRLAKKEAYGCVVARLRSGVTFEALMEATVNYARLKANSEARYILHPKTFYGSNLRYVDFLNGAVGTSENTNAPDAYDDIRAFLERGE